MLMWLPGHRQLYPLSPTPLSPVSLPRSAMESCKPTWTPVLPVCNSTNVQLPKPVLSPRPLFISQPSQPLFQTPSILHSECHDRSLTKSLLPSNFSLNLSLSKCSVHHTLLSVPCKGHHWERTPELSQKMVRSCDESKAKESTLRGITGRVSFIVVNV